MSPSAQIPGPPRPQKQRRNRREVARTGALVTLAVVVTLFAVLNVEQVKVDWIFGSGHAPLIVVIVVSLLVGIVLRHFARSHTGKR